MGVPEVVLDLPLLTELSRLNDEAARRFPYPHSRRFGHIGLILEEELAPGGYWCSPKNALTFASTGGDGDHGGYFQIQLVFPEPRPAGAPEHWFCEHVDEDQRKLLKFLAPELKLKPWRDDERREKFKRLQDELLPLVVASTEPE